MAMAQALIGTSSINGSFSIAMLNNQGVTKDIDNNWVIIYHCPSNDDPILFALYHYSANGLFKYVYIYIPKTSQYYLNTIVYCKYSPRIQIYVYIIQYT